MDEYKSLGIMEYRSVAIGMKAADSMLKAADIRMMMMQAVCPGKYIVIQPDFSQVFFITCFHSSLIHERFP